MKTEVFSYPTPEQFFASKGVTKFQLPFITKGGTEFYIHYKDRTAIVVAFIERDMPDNMILDKKELREMSTQVEKNIFGLTNITLYTNYSLELHSKEKPADVGFTDIVKIISE